MKLVVLYFQDILSDDEHLWEWRRCPNIRFIFKNGSQEDSIMEASLVQKAKLCKFLKTQFQDYKVVVQY